MINVNITKNGRNQHSEVVKWTTTTKKQHYFHCILTKIKWPESNCEKIYLRNIYKLNRSFAFFKLFNKRLKRLQNYSKLIGLVNHVMTTKFNAYSEMNHRNKIRIKNIIDFWWNLNMGYPLANILLAILKFLNLLTALVFSLFAQNIFWII